MTLSSKPTESEIADLKAKHHGVRLDECVKDGATVVLRAPFRAAVKEFERKASAGETMPALRQLFIDCAVWPDNAKIMAALEVQPMLYMGFGKHLMDMAGAGSDEPMGKKTL
jgi:hypothetical protein